MYRLSTVGKGEGSPHNALHSPIALATWEHTGPKVTEVP